MKNADSIGCIQLHQKFVRVQQDIKIKKSLGHRPTAKASVGCPAALFISSKRIKQKCSFNLLHNAFTLSLAKIQQ